MLSNASKTNLFEKPFYTSLINFLYYNREKNKKTFKLKKTRSSFSVLAFNDVNSQQSK